VSLDETVTEADVADLLYVFAAQPKEATLKTKDLESTSLKRETKFLEHPVFHQHRSETQLLRYMKSLENKDLSLVHSMIPLGSCTMKLNGTSEMLACSWPEFANLHPFAPLDQTVGYQALLRELEQDLCEITGYSAVSFQPNSGAQGEYAGLRVIKSYLESKGQSDRNVRRALASDLF
jgi:glycine dehydrogenase